MHDAIYNYTCSVFSNDYAIASYQFLILLNLQLYVIVHRSSSNKITHTHTYLHSLRQECLKSKYTIVPGRKSVGKYEPIILVHMH